MYKLTERRLKNAKPILERYRTELHDRGTINAGVLEKELCECWDTGLRELKDVFQQLSKGPRYRHLTAYYMEHSTGPVVVSEFKPALAALYGIDYYNSPERERMREAFWRTLEIKK
jgi:hypothetical protein